MILGGWKPMENLSSCLQFNHTHNTIDFITKPNNFPVPNDGDENENEFEQKLNI
jgi:hypothetical protein